METIETKNVNGKEIVLRDPEAIYALCERLGLMWVVEKQPLHLPDGTKTKYFGVVRKDTQNVFGVAHETYEIFQNWELAEIVSRIAESRGQKVSRGGLLDGGAKVYIQFAMDDFKVNGDKIERFATGLGSFDLSTSLRWGEQSTIVVCQNTYMRAYHSLKTSVRHTRNMRSIIDQSMRALDHIEQEDKTLLQLFNNMLDTPATNDQLNQIVQTIVGVDMSKTQSEIVREHSARKLDTATKLVESMATEMGSKGRNLWGAWNGITHYTTHLANGTEESREKSKLIGSLQKVDDSILELMKSFIQKGSSVLIP